MKFLAFILFFLICSTVNATVYYVRTDGGTNVQCDGTHDAQQSGATDSGDAGSEPDCAYSHPFYFTGWCGDYPSTCTAGSAGTSDQLVIVSGTYDVGYDASWSGCNAAYKYGCNMQPFPDGTAGTHSKLTGCTTTGCASTDPTTWPVFTIAEGEKFALNLSASDYVDVSYIRLTETRNCGKGHSTLNCTNPDNDGILISDATNIDVNYVRVDGFSRYGIFGGPTTNVTFRNMDINYNSYGGIIGDTTGSCTTCGWGGTVTFDNINVNSNGCVEDNAAYGTIVAEGCYSQTQSGYGDGVGMANTAGTWDIKDSNFNHNTSDGVDLLYHNRGAYSGGTISFKRSKTEGNTGDAIKGSNAITIEDSYIIANCGYFYGQSFTCTTGTCGGDFDYCRSNTGSAIKMEFHSGDSTTPKITNNTIVGNGDVTIITTGTCTAGTDVLTYNNVILGGRQWNDDDSNPAVGTGGDDETSIFYNSDGTCAADFIENYNVCTDNFKEASPCPGANSVNNASPSTVFSGTVLQGPYSSPGYYTGSDYTTILRLKSSSVALNVSDETANSADSLDYNSTNRGASWDAGALESSGSGFSIKGIIRGTSRF